MAKKTLKFDEMLARIEEIVRLLEKGETTLEESLKLYEEGAGLLRVCTKQLDEAEQKVVRLRKGADGQPEELPFDEGE